VNFNHSLVVAITVTFYLRASSAGTLLHVAPFPGRHVFREMQLG